MNSGADIFAIRQKVLDNTDQFGNDYHFLMKCLFNLYVEDRDLASTAMVGQYMYLHSVVIDPEINFTTLLVNLRKAKKP